MFADVDAATDFARTTASDAKTVVVRESNLEDVFIELTGSKVEEGV